MSEECVCELCGCSAVGKYQLVMCEWANCGQLQVNMGNIQKIVNVLLRHTSTTCRAGCFFITYYVITFDDLNKDESN